MLAPGCCASRCCTSCCSGRALPRFRAGAPANCRAGDAEIVVTAADIDRIAWPDFARDLAAPAVAGRDQAAIDDYIREEVLYRAGLALGLDKDDTIVRRRMRQKMEFFFEDTVETPHGERAARISSRRNQAKVPQSSRASRSARSSSARERGDAAAGGRAADPAASGCAGADAAGGGRSLAARRPFRADAAEPGRGAVRRRFRPRAGRLSRPANGPVRSNRPMALHLVLVTGVEPARLPPIRGGPSPRSSASGSQRAPRSGLEQSNTEKIPSRRYRVTVEYPPAGRP